MSVLESRLRRSCFPALVTPLVLYLCSCGADAQSSPGQGTSGAPTVGISSSQLDNIGCPVFPSRISSGTLVWDYDPRLWPDANYTDKALEDPTLWTSFQQAGWSGHVGVKTMASTCGSVEIWERKGTSLLWKDLIVGPGKVFRITVQLMIVKAGALYGLVNGQLVIYGCVATITNLTQAVKISRMSPTQWDATVGPPVSNNNWMTMVVLVRTTHVQLNDNIALALVTGGRSAKFKISLVRVEEVNPSVCSSQNCTEMKDCSDFPGIQNKGLTVYGYKPSTTGTCLVNQSKFVLPVAKHSRTVMHAGKSYRIPFGSMDTHNTLAFSTMLIAQILMNEVIGVGTSWLQKDPSGPELVARVAGFNLTGSNSRSTNLTTVLANTSLIDLSVDAPLDWVALPLTPDDLSEGIDALPNHVKANVQNLGSASLSSYEALFMTRPAVVKATQNGLALDSWTTLSRSFSQYSPTVYSYFNDPESWTSSGGFDYDHAIKCSSISPSTLRSQLENRGYKCWADAWWASPASENYTATVKGKATTKYNCVPFILWNSGLSNAQLTSIFDIVQNTGMKFCVTETVTRFEQVAAKGFDFVTWISFPGEADPNTVNIVDLPAQYVPIRMPYTKIIWQQLRSINRQSFELLTDFSIPNADMTHIILNVRAAAYGSSKSYFQLNYEEACNWVKTHEAVWESWLQVSCDKGFVSAEVNGFITCVRCPAGKFNDMIGVATTCKNCSIGFFSSSDGATLCEECKTGHFRDYEGAAECARCVRGMYSDVVGATACKSCQDMLPRSTTQLLGAQNASDCACEKTSYNPRDYDAGSSAGCQQCPKGIFCPGFAVSGQQPPDRLEPGYYASPFNPISNVWLCVSDKACPGTIDQANNDNPCADKRQGLNCGLCVSRHYAVGQGSTCFECSSSVVFIPIALVAFFLSSGLFHYLWNERAAYVEAGESVLASVTMGVTLAFMQTLGIFDNLHFAWPEEFASVLDFARLFIFDLQFLRPNCLLEQTLATAYLGRLFVPLILTGIFSLWYFAARLLHMLSRFPVFAMRGILNSIGMIVQAVYISLVTSCVSLMECYSSPNGEYAVRGYPYAQCFTTEHLSLIPAMAIAFVGYVVGVFVLFAWLCHVAPRKQGSQFFRHATRFLVFKYHPTKWWYGLVLMVRSLALALVIVVEPSDGYRQFVMMLFILIGSIIVHLEYKPYSDWYANMLESVELSLLIAILGIGSWFIEERDYDGADKSVALVLSVLMCSLVALCFLVLVVVFIYAVWIAKYPEKLRVWDKKEVDAIVKKLMPCVTHLATSEEREVENMLMGATYLDRVYCQKFMNFALLEFSGMQSDKYAEQRLPRKRASYVQNKVTTLSMTKLHSLKRKASEEFVKKQTDSQSPGSWGVGRQSPEQLDNVEQSGTRVSSEENNDTEQNQLRKVIEEEEGLQFRQGDEVEAVVGTFANETSAATLLDSSDTIAPI